MNLVLVFKALGNEMRLRILRWLKDPHANFSPQPIGDFDKDGVCVSFIQEKSGLSQSTVSQYLNLMERAGLVRSKRIGQWTYYSRDEASLARLAETIGKDI